jgi:hypothetical protein
MTASVSGANGELGHDPRGDASVSPFVGPPAADVKTMSARYDPSAGVFTLKLRLWSPVPPVYQLKGFFVSLSCGTSAADVLDYDLGGSAILRIDGSIPVSVTRRTTREGKRLTETWSGPELRHLALGCVRGSVSTGDIGGFGIDEFGPFALR